MCVPVHSHCLDFQRRGLSVVFGGLRLEVIDRFVDIGKSVYFLNFLFRILYSRYDNVKMSLE
jgi:hypothetical protein